MNAIDLNFIIELAETIGGKILYALIIVVVGSKLIKIGTSKISSIHAFSLLDQSIASFIVSFIRIAAYILLFLSVAVVLGVDITSFISVLATAGVAIGLALQGALSNFVGGIMILIFQPFKVGDYITIGDNNGIVSEITVFYTFIKQYDNTKVMLPNGSITNTTIINHFAEENRRVDIEVGVAYDSDLDLVRQVLLETANQHEMVLKDPAATVSLIKHDASSLNFKLKVWCKSDNYWQVEYDLKEQIVLSFRKNNIEIPFPQVDVHTK